MIESKAAVQSLWARVLADDPAAWDELVSRYQALVYTVAVRCGLSLADASDCFQQTWMSLYRTRHQISDPAKLVAWLITTARREAVRMRRRANASVSTDDELEVESLDPTPDIELETLERQLLLRTAIEQLDARDQRLIELMFFRHKDIPYEETAAELGIPLNSLGPTRRRCLNKLRKILESMGITEVRNREWLPLLVEQDQAGKELSVVTFEPPRYC